ncbi:2-oxoglutarate and iron-dependent oxygenase JMJD4 isoform X2 [Tachyglossus aculeatus]|uniref:2-oxoglutarate and iron-dependent oxygenase JMJD4 isoform X2 n=1 Tax=Tachyglossus aculeatus TaxID=9261 RepID=UPI0018F50322|nr:2-oxoglutarate and iron-dependent oxygenase JMJD4 isoform X2 [Tachyglossus aculeatus]
MAGECESRPRGPVDFIEEASALGYGDFFGGYVLPNVPCLLSAAFTAGWGGRARWVAPAGGPDFAYLRRRFGEAVVPVVRCDAWERDANPKEAMPLRDYLDYWMDHIRSGYASPRGCLYLKDWHMARSFPEHDAYTTPVYFSSDWLNEYLDACGADDYRFVYMGPRGSWTPFHADVFHSYSWSANVCGRKRWLLFPPGQEDFLRDRHGNLPSDVLDAPGAPPPGPRGARPRPLEVIQEAGEILFVPSGWHHQDDTISINHNWVNGGNVGAMWRFLQAQLGAVQREVAQWRDVMDDWPGHCQLMLKACAGIDYPDFYRFLRAVAESRLAPGPRHAAFDRGRLVAVLASLLADEDFLEAEARLGGLPPGPRELLARLTAAGPGCEDRDHDADKPARPLGAALCSR